MEEAVMGSNSPGGGGGEDWNKRRSQLTLTKRVSGNRMLFLCFKVMEVIGI